MLKSRLESEGIECFLFDKEIVGLNTLFTWGRWGSKVESITKGCSTSYRNLDRYF